MSETDLQLLTRYTNQRAEDAFTEVVRRHVDLVHSAALRQVRSPELAEEVAQAVFIELARRAGQLPSDTVVSAWLYNQTRRRAIDVVRREAGRRLREQTAQELQVMNATAEDWTHIEPLLDDAMDALEETDRLAVLLRYFQNKPLHEVGQAIGATDDAAQKRVSRAVERLREFFAKHGVNVGASGLVVIISTNAVLVAPAGLSATITAAVVAGTAIATSASVITLTMLQKALIGVTLAAAVGVGIYKASQASRAQAEVLILRQQQILISNQLEQLTRERDDASRQLAVERSNNERLKQTPAELLKLRGDVGLLRQQLADLTRRQIASTGQAEAWTVGGFKSVAELKNAGLATPEAAAQTYWAALRDRNVELLKQCMVFEEKGGTEPISDLYARRESRAESKTRFSLGSESGLFLSAITLSSGHASVDHQKAMQVRPRAGDPANQSTPRWVAVGTVEKLQLANISGEWKITTHTNVVKLVLDDEDPEADAEGLFLLSPGRAENMKEQVPPRTWQAYEELRTKTTR